MVPCPHVSVSSSCAEWLHPLVGWYFIPTVSLNLSLFHTHTQPYTHARTHTGITSLSAPLVTSSLIMHFILPGFFLVCLPRKLLCLFLFSPALVTVLTYVTTWQHKAIKLGNKSPERNPPHVSFDISVKFMTWSYLTLSKTVCFWRLS